MRIAIIGCGHMGKGLAEQLSPFHSLYLYDRKWKHTQALAKKIQAEACRKPAEALEKAQLVLLAIKPQNLKEGAAAINHYLKPSQILISILAGISLAILKQYFPHPLLVRMMPNLAMCQGEGVIGIVNSSTLSEKLKKELTEFLAPLGLIYWLKEDQMDALTSLTGSGPAFMLTLIEVMIEAGLAMGFQTHEAQPLILKMLQGCITLLQKTGKHPAELKWQIASPGGTTLAGLRVLEQEKVRSGFMEAFLAAHQKAQDLAKSHE